MFILPQTSLKMAILLHTVANWRFIMIIAVHGFKLHGIFFAKLTLFQAGGGHYGPQDLKRSAVSTGFGLGSPKFMTLFLSMFDRPQ